MPKVITNADAYQIQPADIKLGKFWEAFGADEAEASAYWIIKLLQERGSGWDPFSEEDIQSLYSKKFKFGRFSFNQLWNRWIIPKNGMFYVTEDFIQRCYKSSPATTAK